jgi:hypothetical protein
MTAARDELGRSESPKRCGRRPARPRLRAAARAAGIAAVTLIAMEVAVRLSGFAERHFEDPIYEPHPAAEIPYVLKSGLVDARGRGLSRVSTDELGLRTPHPERRLEAKREGELRIAFVGDSGTFGEGVVRSEDTFVARLEELFGEARGEGTVRTFNFAASAYSVREMAATLEHRVLAVEPDWVVMVIIPHDLVLARTPKVGPDGHLVDRAFADDGRPAGPARLAREVLRRSHFAYVLRELRESALPRGAEVMTALERGEIPESYAYVRRFRDLARANGVRHLVVMRPGGREEPVPVAALVARMRQDEIDALDLSAIRRDLTHAQFRASRFDGHPSAEAHRRIADALAAYFLESDVRGPVRHPRAGRARAGEPASLTRSARSGPARRARRSRPPPAPRSATIPSMDPRERDDAGADETAPRQGVSSNPPLASPRGGNRSAVGRGRRRPPRGPGSG